ncbi:acyltransferase family protein, partial [Photobacterium angustum]
MENYRNYNYDILRCIALLSIILAHVSPPNFIFQLRNFDVVLIVFISGVVYNESNHGYLKQTFSRILRLVIPVWVFFSLYYLTCYFMLDKIFTLKQYILTYTMISGIGFVWIFRVFISIAILLPIFINMERRGNFYIIFILILITNVISGYFHIFDKIIVEAVNYTFVSYLGYKVKKSGFKTSIRNFSILIFIVFLYLIIKKDIDLQILKYPPDFIYII